MHIVHLYMFGTGVGSRCSGWGFLRRVLSESSQDAAAAIPRNFI